MGQNAFSGSGVPTRDNHSQLLTVTELNARARRMLEVQFGQVRVEGELSGLIRPSSGHWYFILKDAGAQIRCAMFKHKNKIIKQIPKDGTQLQLRGRISLYEGRGDYQLIVDHIEESGTGALLQAFEALKNQLSEEGLFNADRKQAIPTTPRHIGVVTSPTGAAIRDILAVLKRRFPSIAVTIIPCMVQGKDAATDIAKAIKLANKSGFFDVLIVGRGGGSLEDLWSFNEEHVARAIADSKVPVVSAVGHEIDFTIADFVADHRAPTPSAAAEILSPDQQDYLIRIESYRKKLTLLMLNRLQHASQSLDQLNLRLRHPEEKRLKYQRWLQSLTIRLKQTMILAIARAKSDVQKASNSLKLSSPQQQLKLHRVTTDHYQDQLQHLMQKIMERKRHQLHNQSSQLNAVSPLATLSRGYSITEKEGEIIQDSRQLQQGDRITSRFHQGSVECEVISINDA